MTSLYALKVSHSDCLGFASDGYDIWSALTSDAPSPRNEMLYNVNPLCHSGQAAAPKAAIRVGDFKLLAWCFDVEGIANASRTGHVKAPKAQAAK